MGQWDLIIVGGGPAGLTAAVYGVRAGLRTLVVEQGECGGQLMSTGEIENWPGQISVTGFELSQQLEEHAKSIGASFLKASVQSITVDQDVKIVRTDEGDLQAGAVIIATGASFRKLGCPGEKEFTGRGVGYCVVCDGMFYRNKVAAVVGGGNTAAEGARYLTRFASKVYLIHRRDVLRADKVLADAVLADPKIEPVWNTEVKEIRGDRFVESLVLRNVQTGEEKSLPVDGIFPFVGTDSNVSFVSDAVRLTQDGRIDTDDFLETSVPGIFAAGDVRNTTLRQAVTAAGDGARAAMSAYAYLAKRVRRH
ncbi:MAG: thioredoxin-disulfide reductase [Desulfovibrionaceae bacterium]|nr:thioredoxin-disulfide reductase [Desulfovibrionaceae bacterium]